MTWWNNLSRREQRLAIATAAVLMAAVTAILSIRAWNRLEDMDLTILQLQQDLVFYSEQAMLKETVDREYGAMAEQHSSAWSEEEIHDRLRREIARLALRDPSVAPGDAVAATGGDQLVEIRQMPRGVLDTSGSGYRAYQVAFRTEPTDIRNVVIFLERLMQSTQALRIDNLVLKREPQGRDVTAQLTVTRTVINNRGGVTPAEAGPEAPAEPEAPVNLVQNPGFEAWDAASGSFAAWTAMGCGAAPDSSFFTEGAQAATFTAQQANAAVYQTVQAEAGATLAVTFDAVITGTAWLEVCNPADMTPYEGAIPIEGDGQPQRYTLRFHVPAGQAPVSLAAPVIVLEKAGDSVTLDNVSVMTEGAS